MGAGRPAEAVPLFLRSISFLERKHGPFHFDVPSGLLLLAEAYGQMGRGFGERLSLLDRAVTIHELSVGRDKDQDAGQRAVTLQACAECYEEAGHFDEAEERWAKCVAAFEKVRIRRISLTMGINKFALTQSLFQNRKCATRLSSLSR